MRLIEDTKNVKVKWDNDIYGLNDKRVEQFLDHAIVFDQLDLIETLFRLKEEHWKKIFFLIYIFLKLNIFFNLSQQVCSKIASSLLYHPVYINVILRRIEEKGQNLIWTSINSISLYLLKLCEILEEFIFIAPPYIYCSKFRDRRYANFVEIFPFESRYYKETLLYRNMFKSFSILFRAKNIYTFL